MNIDLATAMNPEESSGFIADGHSVR